LFWGIKNQVVSKIPFPLFSHFPRGKEVKRVFKKSGIRNDEARLYFFGDLKNMESPLRHFTFSQFHFISKASNCLNLPKHLKALEQIGFSILSSWGGT